jgi:hypothetical protein
VDSAGEPACELCGRRLRSVKHTRPYGAGQSCHPRCKSANIPTDRMEFNSVAAAAVGGAAAATEPLNKKRRRIQSDPGQEKIITSYSPRSLRLRAPKPVMPDKKRQKLEEEKAIARELDATHKKRMAALKKAATAVRHALK